MNHEEHHSGIRLEEIPEILQSIPPRIGWKLKELELKLNPGAREVMRILDSVMPAVNHYLIPPQDEQLPPEMLVLQTSDGNQYTTLNVFRGEKLQRLPIHKEQRKDTGLYKYFLTLPPDLQLQHDQLAIMLYPNQFKASSLETLHNIYNQLILRSELPNSYILQVINYPPQLISQLLLGNLPQEQQEAIERDLGSSLHFGVTNYLTDLYDPQNWKQVYGIAGIIGISKQTILNFK